jgi:hypothetical protein
MTSRLHFPLAMEFRYDSPAPDWAWLIGPVSPETKCNQILQLHRSSSTFQSYGAEYRWWQLPILNAFALIIHKVQGLSLPSITLALNKNIFSESQAYVGLSRATMLDQVFLTQLDFDATKADPEAIAEYNRLRTIASLLET